MYPQQCIICGQNTLPAGPDPSIIQCGVCGPYRASHTLMTAHGIAVAGVADDQRHLVAAWVRRKFRFNEDPPSLTSSLVQSIIANAPRYTPDEKMRQLLLAVGKQVRKPGVAFELSQLSYADAWAADAGEMKAYIRWMDADGFTEPVQGNQQRNLTRKGWLEFDRLQRRSDTENRRAFVAMWFDDEMDEAYTQGIAPAVTAAGFDPFRMKGDIHDERIDARIIASIRESRFVIADVTGARTAVYYEAGFTEGLGKPVIWTCRTSHQQDMSFDTRQFLHILWEDPADLRAKLEPVIKARII